MLQIEIGVQIYAQKYKAKGWEEDSHEEEDNDLKPTIF